MSPGRINILDFPMKISFVPNSPSLSNAICGNSLEYPLVLTFHLLIFSFSFLFRSLVPSHLVFSDRAPSQVTNPPSRTPIGRLIWPFLG